VASRTNQENALKKILQKNQKQKAAENEEIGAS